MRTPFFRPLFAALALMLPLLCGTAQAASKADTSKPFTPSFSRGGSSAGAGRPR